MSVPLTRLGTMAIEAGLAVRLGDGTYHGTQARDPALSKFAALVAADCIRIITEEIEAYSCSDPITSALSAAIRKVYP